MNEDRLGALRRVYDEWAQGNFRAGAELLAPNVHCVWQVAAGDVVCHGPEELARNLRDFLAQWSGWRVLADEYVQVADNVVLVSGRQSMRGKRSEAAVESAIHTAWVFDDDRVVGLYWYFDRDDALAAAGVSAPR